ncbi:MAG TPA: GDSL-type esterase/lipase family protein [Fibrobacteria bacterium]|nr:GDSL-type esterase/lipase family protein [Fibrobacteria bacterium]
MKLLDSLLPLGRFDDTEPTAVRWAWSGSGFAVVVSGTSLRARVAGSRSWLNVRVGTGDARVLELAPDREWVDLASGLPRGEHEIRVELRTEPLVGELVLSGLETDGRILAPPPRRGLRIEFVGDSITCGYGNLAPDESHSFDPATEDFSRSWAGLTGRRLGADVHCVAWSGLGLVRNFDLEPAPTLIERYRYANPVSRVDWEFGRWLPQVVVVNLGSNDFFRYPPPDAERFRSTLARFVSDRLQGDAGTKVVLVDGPLLKDGVPLDESGRGQPSLSLVRGHLDAVADSFDPAAVFRLSLTPAHPDRGYGADWHPNLAQHRLNADELVQFLVGRGLAERTGPG